MSKLSLLIAAPWLGSLAAAHAADADQLAAMINNMRAAPGLCAGAPARAVPPLTPQAALAAVRIKPGTILSAALERAGYANSKSDAISLSGVTTPQDAMTAIGAPFCRTLLSADYSDIGVSREGDEWNIVLAQPAAPLPSATFPAWQDAGKLILEGVNAARAAGQVCGGQAYPPAPPLRWNEQLGEAALAHSGDMAARRYFSHTAKDGSNVGERARRAGYNWTRIGENIAFGSYTPQEVLAGWLSSPGHCVNIMNSGFTEMGAAYAVTPEQRAGVIYWTQDFGKPRQ
nr:CAP domain-containing protein [uncultured Duganella sp.]